MKGTNAGKAQNGSDKPKISVMLKLIGVLTPIIAIVIIALVFVVRSTTSRILVDKSDLVIARTSESVVNRVEGWMNGIIAQLDTQRDTLEYADLTPEEELEYIRYMVDPTGPFPGGLYIGTTDHRMIHASWNPGPEFDPVTRGWYQEGLTTAQFRFGDPYLDAITNAIVVPAMSVLRDRAGTVRGVAAGDVELAEISKIVSEVRIEQTGGAFMVDTNTAIVIGAGDSSVVGLSLSELSDVADGLYAQAAPWITNHSEGVHNATVNGKTLNYYLQSVPDSRWVLVSYVPAAEVLGDVTALTTRLTILALAAIVILSILIAVMLYQIVILPVRKLDAVARNIASGNLDTRVDYHSSDEFGTLSSNFGKTVDRLHSYVGYIDEISQTLNNIANGNLVFQLKYEYSGEFEKVKTALENISRSLNETISKIDRSSQQVSAGAEHLSSGSQNLSQGATEQAAAVEELSATIAELSSQVQKSATDARDVSDAVNTTENLIAQSDERMQLLIRSMGEINSSSREIDKIIKVIDDIAFQTNILALNAAVEAARAGAAGKGFAVVADEVRNLANKSAAAAASTADLIKASVDAVQHGSGLADETAESLRMTVADIKSINQAVNEISQASEAQAKSIAQVSEGIRQISDVVQSNSATSEQTAASSQELSAQAHVLQELVENFRLQR